MSHSTHGAKDILVICFQQPFLGSPGPTKPAADLSLLHDFWGAGGRSCVCVCIYYKLEGGLRISDDRKLFEIGNAPFLVKKDSFLG